ncbi:MAG TPA: hypothetical protein VNH11_35025 [Pirellulales bacterium]|nr:hypothetical protein [Pirellulales bacterium]
MAKPLNGLPDGNEPSHLADAVYKLNQRQTHIDFHADGGAVRWEWRQKKATRHPSHNGKPKRPARRNGRRERQEDR